MAIIADRSRQLALHEGIAARYGLDTEHLASGGLTGGPHLLYRFALIASIVTLSEG